MAERKASAPKVSKEPEASALPVDPHEVGYVGDVPDPHPDEDYSIAGVTNGRSPAIHFIR